MHYFFVFFHYDASFLALAQHPAVDLNCDRMLSFQPLQLLRITKTITQTMREWEKKQRETQLHSHIHTQCFIYTDYFYETAVCERQVNEVMVPERIGAQRWNSSRNLRKVDFSFFFSVSAVDRQRVSEQASKRMKEKRSDKRRRNKFRIILDWKNSKGSACISIMNICV